MRAYIINLPHATERRSQMQEQISKINGIDFVFFDAISWDDPRMNKYRSHWDWDIFVKLYRGRALSHGEKACFASHFALWEECVGGGEPMLILEDDVVFAHDFEEKILALDESLGFVRMMAYFQKKLFKKWADGIDQTLEDICGSQGYFLTPRSALLFLQKAKIWFCPVDNYMDKTYLHGVKNLFFSPSVISENPMMQSCINQSGRRSEKIPFGYNISKEFLTLFERIWRWCYGWKNKK